MLTFFLQNTCIALLAAFSTGGWTANKVLCCSML